MSNQVIKSSKFPQSVRGNVGMFLSSPNHCIFEIIDNSVDEFVAGYAKHIHVQVLRDTTNAFPLIRVIDDGRGIPTSLTDDPDFKGQTQAEMALCNLSTGGKFEESAEGYATVTSGMHGVGASCVNATSNSFEAVIYHGGTKTVLRFAKGLIEKRSIEEPIADQKRQGTEITFALDDTIWEDEADRFDFAEVKKRMWELAYLNSGLELSFEDGPEHERYYEEQGFLALYQDIISSKAMLADKDAKGNTKELFKTVAVDKLVHDLKDGDIEIKAAFSYAERNAEAELHSFVNNVATTGGDHNIGFKEAVTKAIKDFYEAEAKNKRLLKYLPKINCHTGLIALISVKVKKPIFIGQAKTVLKKSTVRKAVRVSVYDALKLYLEQNPVFAEALAKKLLASYIPETPKPTLPGGGNPEKLAACSCKNPEECSLYLVEGDSAAGSAIQGRDSKTQAILPVFGKVLNSEKQQEDKVQSNSKLLEVVKALKCGIGKKFNINNLRYHKIIIMADADTDGAHISTLWITFFYRQLPELVRRGYLYIALSPIYRVMEQVGKKEEARYFFDDDELNAYKATVKNKYHVSYIKGLGELQPRQLWESTMDPSRRRLIRVTEGDAELASDAIDLCMGDDAKKRWQFIASEADFTKAVE